MKVSILFARGLQSSERGRTIQDDHLWVWKYNVPFLEIIDENKTKLIVKALSFHHLGTNECYSTNFLD